MIMALDVFHLVSGLEFSVGFRVSVWFLTCPYYCYFIYLSPFCYHLLASEFFFCKCSCIAQYSFVLASVIQALSVVFYRSHHGLMWLGGQ